MVGKYIQVVAEGAVGTAKAATTVAVREADSKEVKIASAEQTKKSVIEVTFDGKLAGVDTLKVFKGEVEKEISKREDAADGSSTTLTMKDALTEGTYTVKLTPADTAVDPSEASFEAKTATKATRIEIEGDYLVMKDTHFQEGYVFIKGYNAFDEQITLSGLTVTAAPSDNTQYEPSTGKLTVKSATENQYAIIKNVNVYAQYMNGLDVVTAQKTLEVSNIGYPAEVEFGEVTKDTASGVEARKDGRLTINELATGLYYIPIKSIKDNYGNEMLAEDLNKLETDSLLTTVPTPDTNNIYFATHKPVFTEKDGQIVVYLDAGNDKPGEFEFMIASAGGTFTKNVVIDENPYIAGITVGIPEIYENEESDDWSFSAVDQYGEDVNIYDMLDTNNRQVEFPGTPGILHFLDSKHLTNSHTKIDAGAAGTFRIQKFATDKTYKVTFIPAATTKAKGVITFVTTDADFNVQTAVVTVGGRGGASNISSGLKSAAVVDFDFNKNLIFTDTNGKTMDRAHNNKYPTAIAKDTLVEWTADSQELANLTDEKIADTNNGFAFYYMVAPSTTKPTADVVQQKTVGYTLTQPSDGVAKVTGSYTVYLLASSDNCASKANTRLLETKTYHVANKQKGDYPVSYALKLSKSNLYVGDAYDDSVGVKVTVTFNNGFKDDFAADGVSLNGASKVSGSTITKGALKGDGTATVAAYLTDSTYTNVNGDVVAFNQQGAVCTGSLAYSDDDPVASKVVFNRTTDKAKFNTEWTEDETEVSWDTAAGVTSKLTATNGILKLTDGNVAGDTYACKVQDQYGHDMSNVKYYINGVEQHDETYPAGDVLEVKAESTDPNAKISKTFRLNVNSATNSEVDADAAVNATTNAYTIELTTANTLTYNSTAGTATFNVKKGSAAYKLTNDGTITITGPEGFKQTTPGATDVGTSTAALFGINITAAGGVIQLDQADAAMTLQPGTYTLSYKDAAMEASITFVLKKTTQGVVTKAALVPTAIAETYDTDTEIYTTTVTITGGLGNAASPTITAATGKGTYTITNTETGDSISGVDVLTNNTTLVFKGTTSLFASATGTATSGAFTQDDAEDIYVVKYVPSSIYYNDPTTYACDETDLTGGAAGYTQKAVALSLDSADSPDKGGTGTDLQSGGALNTKVFVFNNAILVDQTGEKFTGEITTELQGIAFANSGYATAGDGTYTANLTKTDDTDDITLTFTKAAGTERAAEYAEDVTLTGTILGSTVVITLKAAAANTEMTIS